MSVSILNITGNKRGFEDKLVNDITDMLRQKIGSNEVMQTSVRGDDLVPIDSNLVEDHHIILILAHGCSRDDQTFIDTGLSEGLPDDFRNHGNEILNSISNFYSIFPRNNVNYIFVFYSCRQLSPESMAGTDDPQCLGVVVSQEELEASHFPSITDLVADLHNLFDNNVTDESIQNTIRLWKNSHPNGPCFRYFPTMTVYSQEE